MIENLKIDYKNITLSKDSCDKVDVEKRWNRFGVRFEFMGGAEARSPSLERWFPQSVLPSLEALIWDVIAISHLELGVCVGGCVAICI